MTRGHRPYRYSAPDSLKKRASVLGGQIPRPITHYTNPAQAGHIRGFRSVESVDNSPSIKVASQTLNKISAGHGGGLAHPNIVTN
jgi:hypothetical protein